MGKAAVSEPPCHLIRTGTLCLPLLALCSKCWADTFSNVEIRKHKHKLYLCHRQAGWPQVGSHSWSPGHLPRKDSKSRDPITTALNKPCPSLSYSSLSAFTFMVSVNHQRHLPESFSRGQKSPLALTSHPWLWSQASPRAKLETAQRLFLTDHQTCRDFQMVFSHQS